VRRPRLFKSFNRSLGLTPVQNVQAVQRKLDSFKPFNRFAPFKTLRTKKRFREQRSVVEQGLEKGLARRDDRWSEAIAVGSRPFVEKVKS
jgi:hypothetical protein